MYELIWNFLFNNLLGFSSSGIFYDDGFGLADFFTKVITQNTPTVTVTAWSLYFNPTEFACLFCHILTIIILSLLVFAFIKLIKGLFRVFGGMIKW